MRAALLLVPLLLGCDSKLARPASDADATRPAGDRDALVLEGAAGRESTSPEPPIMEKSFTAAAGDLLNPERGFHTEADLVAGSVPDARSQGMTLVRAYVRLDAYRIGAIDAAFLTKLGAGFDKLRAAGLKVVLRFAYNFGIGEPDASKAQILAHLGQLKPILVQHADVIAVLQAGFIGAWGEWHSSMSGLDNDKDRGEILSGILDALPASRMTQLRTPMFKKSLLGGPLADAKAFDGSAAARVGQHNDCFLDGPTDAGTYQDPIDTWKAFVAQEGRFMPVGGETCAVSAPRSDCPTARAELAQLHWSYLNLNYHQDVVAGWKSQGCFDEIKSHLGYRLALTRASWSERVRPGGILALSFSVQNSGYAALYNERPVLVVLDDGKARLSAALARVDPRRWEPGQTVSVSAKLRVPATAATGKVKLALWLPDAASTLRDKPAYAVRLANEGTWSDSAGYNVLTDALGIDAQATGAVDPTATTFVELP